MSRPNTQPTTHAKGFRNPQFAWGALVFFIALTLRVIGIGWGLPNERHLNSLHPDEPVVWMASQRIDIARGKLDPGFYNYGTLYLTVLSVATRAVDAYGGGPASDSPKDTFSAIGRYHLAGRVISALAGAGMAWAVFGLLYRRTHLFGAVAGGLAVAFSPGLVVHSRFQTVDVFAAFLLTLSLLFAVRLFPSTVPDDSRTDWRNALLAGCFAGLAAGTKYTGALALLALIFALMVVPRTSRWLMMGASVGAAMIAFIVATPGALINSGAFLRDVGYEMTHTATGHGLVFAATPNGFVFHLLNLMTAMGGLLVLTGVGGLIWALSRRLLWIAALCIFALATYIVIGRAEVKFLRYALPLIPVLAVGFGYLLGECHIHINQRVKLWIGLGIVALGGFGGGGLAASAVLTQQMVSEDPRDEAARWLQDVARDGTVGLVRDPWFQSPTLYPEVAMPRSVPVELRRQWMRSATYPRVVQYIPEPPESPHEWDQRLITDLRPDYIVFSSFETDDVERILASKGAPKTGTIEAQQYREFSAKLQASYTLDKQFGIGGPTAHDLMYIRPRLWVWKKKPTVSASPSTGSSTISGSNGVPASTP